MALVVCMYPSGMGPAYSAPICWGLFKWPKLKQKKTYKSWT